MHAPGGASLPDIRTWFTGETLLPELPTESDVIVTEEAAKTKTAATRKTTQHFHQCPSIHSRAYYLSLCAPPHLLPLFTVHLFPLSTMPHQPRLCEWLSEKIRLLLQTNSSCFGSSCCIQLGERSGKVVSAKSACSWPRRMHLH